MVNGTQGIGVNQSLLNQEAGSTSNSVNIISPFEYGSDIGADRFERLKVLHDEVVGLTHQFKFAMIEDLRAVQRVGVNIGDTDREFARAMNVGDVNE